ncbi:50S ribosomal protein L28 [Candidatus Bealeia paramacronuclearis]|uniref:Large ribosomal subunit protein bL28 n=1 Tax=Candidatus Bealeia paramacronuclearis TaxID=1921001 RepID=A0ABZ2C4T6_9PROT|nr:50S ribosomal protein L28 [Candidatus Bealeia paramacronuclearis]
MPRQCVITGKKVMSGHNVSHSNIKSKRTFSPNLQIVSFLSEKLGKIRMRVSPRGLKTVEKNGGIDSFLLNTSDRNLTADALKLKSRIQKASAE